MNKTERKALIAFYEPTSPNDWTNHWMTEYPKPQDWPMEMTKQIPTENKEVQPCGHPASEIVSSDEGACYCGACEREARE